MPGRSLVLRLTVLAALLAGADAGPLRAQAPLPNDSLELGRKYATWFLKGEADSLAARMSPTLLERLGGPDGVRQGMVQLEMQVGNFVKLVEEQFVWRGDARQYWYTAQMTALPEPIVLRFVMQPSGAVSGLGMNPLSRNPPVDSVGPVIKP